MKKRPDLLRRQGERFDLASEESAEEVKGDATLLPACSPHGHENGLSFGTGPSAVAAPNFAEDDAEAHRLFGPPVGRVQAWEAQEGEEFLDVLPEMFGHAFVDGSGFGGEDSVFQGVLQAAARHRPTMVADFAGGVTIT